MMVYAFDFKGFHVEIHFNVVYMKFFWVTGYGPRRFSGACEYFENPEKCRDDAERNLGLLAKEMQS